MKKFKLLFSLLVLLLIANKLEACSCEYYRNIDLRQYNSYDLVFKGEVILLSENRDEWKKTVNFLIRKTYKGNVENDTLTLFTGLDGASCGLNFKIGQTWMIFSNNEDGKYFTGLCSRSKLLNGNPFKYLKFVADKGFVKKYKSYSGTVSNKDSKGELINGQPIGEWTYFKDGKIWEVHRYAGNGVLHGTSEFYYDEGPLHYKVEYKNGEYIRSVYYQKDGTIDSVYEKE